MSTLLSPDHRPLVTDHVADVVSTTLTAIDTERHLPAPVVSALTDADLFRLYTPTEHGGAELDPAAFCTVVERIARLDASVAWCVWNGNCGFAAPLLDPATAELVFGSGRPVGNSARVAGAAHPAEGGFHLTGSWNLVSGSDHQAWIILFGMVMDGDAPRLLDGSRPDVRAFFVRREQCSVVDRWDVLGLRGTSSNEVVVDGAFVPGSLAVDPFAPTRIERTLYRIPIFTTASCGAAAVCLGIAGGAIDDLVALAATKPSIRGSAPIAGQADLQAAVAEADIALHACRAALHESLASLTAEVADGRAASLAERARVRAAMSHAARTSRTVTIRMFELGSSSAIYNDSPLSRRLRDVMVAAQHVMLQPVWFEEAGRVLLGLEPTLPVM